MPYRDELKYPPIKLKGPGFKLCSVDVVIREGTNKERFINDLIFVTHKQDATYTQAAKIAKRLVKTIYKDCSVKEELKDKEIQIIKLEIGDSAYLCNELGEFVYLEDE